MSEWLKLSQDERKTVILQTAVKLNLSVEAIEKDWWVTTALRALFQCDFANAMVFKGGTSLSKAWKLIERFSEDIDIAIDISYLGFSGELKKKEITELRRASCSFVNTILLYQLDRNLQSLGVTEYKLSLKELKDTTADTQVVELSFDSLFGEGEYIKEKVLIEIGARSLIEPSQNKVIKSLISEQYPNSNFADKDFDIPTVLPTRTFLEKVFLLHEKFQKPVDPSGVVRLSRHFYDLEKLMDTDFAKAALADKILYESIVEHRRKLTKISGIDYSTHNPQTINFIPPDHIIDALKSDYEDMRSSMIYGESLSFDSLISRIPELNKRFHL